MLKRNSRFSCFLQAVFCFGSFSSTDRRRRPVPCDRSVRRFGPGRIWAPVCRTCPSAGPRPRCRRRRFFGRAGQAFGGGSLVWQHGGYLLGRSHSVLEGILVRTKPRWVHHTAKGWSGTREAVQQWERTSCIPVSTPALCLSPIFAGWHHLLPDTRIISLEASAPIVFCCKNRENMGVQDLKIIMLCGQRHHLIMWAYVVHPKLQNFWLHRSVAVSDEKGTFTYKKSSWCRLLA